LKVTKETTCYGYIAQAGPKPVSILEEMGCRWIKWRRVGPFEGILKLTDKEVQHSMVNKQLNMIRPGKQIKICFNTRPIIWMIQTINYR
jgi:hypothetical protein